MTLNEYQRLAQRTSPDGHDRIKNGCMGLIGESGEIVDLMKKYLFQSTPGTPLPTDKLIKEMGDVMWYIAETVTGMGRDLNSVLTDMEPVEFDDVIATEDFSFALSVQANSVYCNIYVLSDEERAAINLRDLYDILRGLCTRIGTTIEHVQEVNIEKLRKRYPDGFDPERSMNRPEYQREEETEPASGILFSERNRTV